MTARDRVFLFPSGLNHATSTHYGWFDNAAPNLSLIACISIMEGRKIVTIVLTGFSTSHFTLQTMYEQSLQTIDPSIALPYWDFTNRHCLNLLLSENLYSFVMIGLVMDHLHTVISGRFAYVPVVKNAKNYSRLLILHRQTPFLFHT